MANQRPTLACSPPVLPKDVVREAFALFAGTTLATSKPTEYPWFLGHICSTWRSVFLSMNELWPRISVSFDLEGNERQKNIVQFFLERDLTAPFSLNLEFPTTTAEREEDNMLHALEMLVIASERWTDASFKATVQQLLPLRRAQNRLPLLQRFKLTLLCQTEADPLFDILQNAPSLTAIDVEEPASWVFNLANLKSITMYFWDSGTSNFIAALPKLEQLILHEELLLPSPIIILPNLIKLDCTTHLLSLLEAPLLQNLSINFRHQRSSDADIVQSFLRRSLCTMNILFLGINGARAAVAIEIIKLTPQIVHLKLVSVDKVGNVFEQLTVSAKPGQQWLACHMQSLSIHKYYGSDDQLFDLVSSRTDSVAGNHGYDRLQKLVQSDVSPRVIALCKERGIQYAENE
ncbi:hypothetical protein APHAL10511_008379 [Amanita phalloides]|nr:hypothetical protein APHAL10511_008379 [Amanita phalloides]